MYFNLNTVRQGLGSSLLHSAQGSCWGPFWAASCSQPLLPLSLLVAVWFLSLWWHWRCQSQDHQQQRLQHQRRYVSLAHHLLSCVLLLHTLPSCCWTATPVCLKLSAVMWFAFIVVARLLQQDCSAEAIPKLVSVIGVMQRCWLMRVLSDADVPAP